MPAFTDVLESEDITGLSGEEGSLQVQILFKNSPEVVTGIY